MQLLFRNAFNAFKLKAHLVGFTLSGSSDGARCLINNVYGLAPR